MFFKKTKPTTEEKKKEVKYLKKELNIISADIGDALDSNDRGRVKELVKERNINLSRISKLKKEIK